MYSTLYTEVTFNTLPPQNTRSPTPTCISTFPSHIAEKLNVDILDHLLPLAALPHVGNVLLHPPPDHQFVQHPEVCVLDAVCSEHAAVLAVGVGHLTLQPLGDVPVVPHAGDLHGVPPHRALGDIGRLVQVVGLGDALDVGVAHPEAQGAMERVELGDEAALGDELHDKVLPLNLLPEPDLVALAVLPDAPSRQPLRLDCYS
eukprot:CAMPEP_0174948870 /NCGR_PEP_ID=MMETSP1355-20121228/90141_1 /TAXON_ID=464990 /ORGANISM="Hemiselmis tepida, Strain CCMP443" /LENGTH=201 /DNA_ID=CAMNT_0016196409 /DNA_START=8 /DNA_END=609 /DNA_ORIENTATION=+